MGAQVYTAVCMYLYMSCKYLGVGVTGCVCIGVCTLMFRQTVAM